MKKGLLFILGFTIAIISSCEYKYIDPVAIEIDYIVSFADEIAPVFQEKCVTCHSSTNPVLTEGRAYTSLIDGNYINVDDPESSTLYVKASSGHPGGNSALNAEELAIILKWIKDGANDN